MKGKKNAPAPNSQLLEISAGCRKVATQHNQLQLLLAQIREEQLAIARKHANALQSSVSLLAALKAQVTGLVTHARALFLSPKSRVFEGVKVGYEKARDAMHVPADELLVQRIKDVLPEKAALLIHQPPPAVRLDVLKTLPREELQQLGVSWETGADNVIVRLGKSDVEEQAVALLAAMSQGSTESRPTVEVV